VAQEDQLLNIHHGEYWQIPAVIVTGSQRHCFSGEEVLIVSLAKLATVDLWTCLITVFFGGDVQRWTAAFRWFINH
jgi:hypothetical protein